MTEWLWVWVWTREGGREGGEGKLEKVTCLGVLAEENRVRYFDFLSGGRVPKGLGPRPYVVQVHGAVPHTCAHQRSVLAVGARGGMHTHTRARRVRSTTTYIHRNMGVTSRVWVSRVGSGLGHAQG